jgi:hypothetical protein
MCNAMAEMRIKVINRYQCAETIADLRNQLEEAREELRTTQAKKKKVCDRCVRYRRPHTEKLQLAERVLEAVCCSICLEPFKKTMM